MGIQEISSLFDTLYNNINNNQAPGLNEWEKSVFLTKAQDEILKNYFNPKSNKNQEGFDDVPKRQIDFSSITEKAAYDKVKKAGVYDGDPQDIDPLESDTIDPRAFVFPFPEDVYFIINETLVFNEYSDAGALKEPNPLKTLQVMPLKNSEYTRLMSRPYKAPLKNQAWRLIDHKPTEWILGGNSDTLPMRAEIILTPSDAKLLANNIKAMGDTEPRDQYTIEGKYIIRYIRVPYPIILEDFDAAGYEDLEIRGRNKPKDIANDIACELDPAIHEEIVQRAVELAKIAWQGDLQASLTAGQRSE